MTETAPSECSDCGTTFRLRTDDSICQKCEKLSQFKRDTADYQQLEEQPQCAFCGLTRRNNMPLIGTIQTCGASRCVDEARKENGSATSGTQGGSTSNNNNTNSVPETYEARAAAMKQRLRTSVGTTRAGTSLHTAALIFHEGGTGGQAEDMIRLAVMTRMSDSKATNTKIGNLIKLYRSSIPMPDLVQEIVDVVSPQFVKYKLGMLPLEIGDVDLRWSGNRLPEPNSMTGSLANFYMMHSSTTEKIATYVNNIPSIFRTLARGHNTKLLCLELVVNMDSYGDREELDAVARNLNVDEPNSTSRKRAISGTSSGGLSKRLRALTNSNIGSTLGSRFGAAGSSHTPALMTPKTQSRVTLERCDISVHPPQYEPELIQKSGQIEAVIDDVHFAKGGSKLAYDMTIFVNDKEERAVAKRIYRTSDDDSHSLSNGVSVVHNRALLESECHRLALGRELFGDFVAYCKEMDVAIFNFIEFSSAYLAQEMLVQVTRSPSVASGLDSFEDEGMTWMVEPKRAAAVIQFTSTLNHKARGSDLTHLTIHSFAHYVFGSATGTLVMADIQGTPATVRGHDGLVLFDVMTHTQDGGSGLGDFGLEGIESFINTHQCNQLCKRLEFDDIFPLELPADIPGPDATEASGSEGAGPGEDGDDQDVGDD
ncbi:kinase-like domain-containing protein [Roridomyces roridus]|uniref:Kinase-like domain-containing protein n=1 Tax=Roridomyces roridus TaxID=1738132 RepID=A0AAD7C5Q5_9AGAR|nr:kinase-like domain-containing protein [Roridomyces roridus]